MRASTQTSRRCHLPPTEAVGRSESPRALAGFPRIACSGAYLLGCQRGRRDNSPVHIIPRYRERAMLIRDRFALIEYEVPIFDSRGLQTNCVRAEREIVDTNYRTRVPKTTRVLDFYATGREAASHFSDPFARKPK